MKNYPGPMDNVKRQKKIPRFVKISGLVVILIFIILILLLQLAPGIVKSYIKGQAKDMGLASPGLEVRDFNLSKLDIQKLQLGDNVSVPFLSVDYSLWALLRGDIKHISVSGMTLQLDYNENKKEWILKGLEPLFNQQKQEKGKGNLILRNLRVDSSILRINTYRSGQPLLIPLEFKAGYIEKTKSYDFSAGFYPFGEAVFIKGNLNPDSGNGKITIHSDNFQPGNILSSLDILPGIFFKSRVRFRADLSLKDWKIQYAEVNAGTDEFRVFHPLGYLEGSLNLDVKVSEKLEPTDIRFRGAVKSLSFSPYNLAIDTPFTFHVQGDRMGVLEFEFSPFEFSEPHNLRAEALYGKISGLPGRPEIKGSYRFEIPRGFIGPILVQAMPFPMTGEFKVNPGSEKEDPVWEIKGNGSSSGSFLSYGDMESKCGHMELEFVASGGKTDTSSSVKIDIKKLSIKFEDFVFSADRLHSFTKVTGSPGSGLTGSGRLKVLGGRLEQADGLKAGGITLDFPWTPSLPREDKAGKTGTFHIQTFEVSGFHLNNITGQVRQNRQGFEFSGDIHTPLKDLKLNLSGYGKFSGDREREGLDLLADFSIPSTFLPEGTDLGKLHPLLQGIRGSGELSGFVRISSLMGSEAALRTTNTSISLDLDNKSGKLVINGLNGELKLKDLFNFVSEKRQQLNFKNLNIGGIPLTGGELTFEIESPESIFFESGEFKCFNGRILLNPLRYMTDSGDIHVSFYCDRIDFDRLVNTIMGEEIAFGDAELNGIIPVVISEGVPVFKDGYLYSTPGIKGNIKFRESSVVSGGVLLVEEAVKDFNYDWIKVKMYSVGKLLNVNVVMDGVPAGKLPLTFNSKSKDIVRDRSGKKRINLKGLLLELNFKDIDLENLLKQGSKIYLYNKKKK